MGNLRLSIIKTAETEFVKFGIRSVSIDDLCNILHISKKTFYTEFKQKDELVSLVLESISKSGRKEDEEYVRNCEHSNAIDVALCYRLPSSRNRRKKLEKFMRDLIKYFPEIHKNFYDSKRESIKKVLLDNILKGVREGLYREELGDLDIDHPLITLIYNWFRCTIDNSDDLFSIKMDGYMRIVCNNAGFEYYQKLNSNRI